MRTRCRLVTGVRAWMGVATRLAARAASADLTVSLEIIAGVPHVFQGFAGILDEAGTALANAGTFIRTHLTT